MARDAEAYKEMNEVLHEAWHAWQPAFEEMKKDLEFYLGKQWTAQDEAYLDQQKRPHLVINKNIRRFVHLLSGYHRQNKMAISFKPFEGSDRVTADQFSRLMIPHQNKAQHHIDRCFGTQLKVGLNWINCFIDFNEDFLSGDIRFKITPWSKIMVDPLFQELDLSDATYLFRREKLTEKQLSLLFPDKIWKKDIKPSTGPDGQMILDPGQSALFRQTERYNFTEWWTRDVKLKTYLVDKTSGNMRPFDARGKMEQEKLALLMMQYPQLAILKKRVPIVNLKLFVGEDLIWSGEDPIGCGDFPYVPFICYYDPEYDLMKWKLQGLVRPLRDSQTELNKRRSALLHILNTIAVSGWQFEEDAVVNEDDMLDASGAGVLLKMREGKMDRAKQIERGGVPTEYVRVEELFAGDPIDITGINAELLAQMEKDTPGIAIQLRQRQGLVIIQEIFDNLRMAKQSLGQLWMKCVQHNYKPQKILRILQEQPSPQFYLGEFQKYDTVIDDAPDSTTQRDYQFQKLAWYHENVGPIHPLIMLDVADIPEKYRDLQIQFTMALLQGQMGMAPPGPQPGGGGKKGPPKPGQKTQGMRQIPAPADMAQEAFNA